MSEFLRYMVSNVVFITLLLTVMSHRFNILSLLSKIEDQDIPIRYRQLGTALFVLPAFLSSIFSGIVTGYYQPVLNLIFFMPIAICLIVAYFNGLRIYNLDQFKHYFGNDREMKLNINFGHAEILDREKRTKLVENREEADFNISWKGEEDG